MEQRQGEVTLFIVSEEERRWNSVKVTLFIAVNQTTGLCWNWRK